jgi:hypothetical protein
MLCNSSHLSTDLLSILFFNWSHSSTQNQLLWTKDHQSLWSNLERNEDPAHMEIWYEICWDMLCVECHQNQSPEEVDKAPTVNKETRKHCRTEFILHPLSISSSSNFAKIDKHTDRRESAASYYRRFPQYTRYSRKTVNMWLAKNYVVTCIPISVLLKGYAPGDAEI